MAEQFDVIVVGARCAGSPLATMLARAGLDVCVVDKASFPSETPSTHGIQPVGVKVLSRLGVLDRLLELTPPIDRGTMIAEDVRLEVDGVVERLGAPMVMPRRVTLDALLVDAAREAGADIRESTPVTGLVTEEGRVAGVATGEGELRARLVVGADGARSTVARLVGATEYHATPPGRAFLWGYFEGVPSGNDGLWLGKRGDCAYLAGPSDAGLFIAATGVSTRRRDEVRADRQGCFETALAGWPELRDSLGDAKLDGPVRMMSGWHGFFRQSAGPGWVLVGDAGHFKDPTPGQGISDALRQAEELAPVIERALGGAGDPERMLRDWWAWRDRDAWDMYWFARDMGAAGVTPPLEREIFQRLVTDPDGLDGLLRVLSRELPPSAIFTPSLALTQASRALLRHRGERRGLLREAWGLVGRDVRRRAHARRTLGVAAYTS